MSNVAVTVGDQVFAKEGGSSFGAVRVVHAHALLIDIEGAGDISIPASAVRSVHDGKVVLDVGQLDEATQRAIRAAHVLETE